MTIVGRLKEGDMIVKEELDERLPAITDGLVAHFPFDETEKGIRVKNILDSSNWFPGQPVNEGDFTGYSSNNEKVLGTDPWGKPTVLWEGISVEGSTASSGIYSKRVPVDPTKMYRMSWWERRVTNSTATYARYYSGLNAYGSTNGVASRSTGTVSTNPYFHLAHNLPVYPKLGGDEWTLVVAHVWPHDSGTGSSHSDSGIYTIREGKIGELYYSDFVWLRETTTAMSRTLSLYTPNAGGVIHHSCYPRIDVCDGSEPTIQDLLMGEGNVYNATTKNNLSTYYGVLGIGESTTNLAVNTISNYAAYHDLEQIGTYLRFTMKGNNRFIVFQIPDIGTVKGKTYSYSGIAKKNGRPMGFYGNRINTNNAVADNSIFYSNPETGEFRMTETMNNTTNWIVHTPTRSNDGDVITIENFQIEEKEYTSPYVNGTSANARLDIPFNLRPPYAVNFWHKGLKPLSKISSQVESPMLLQFNNYASSPSVSIWNYNKGLRIFGRGNQATGWTMNQSNKTFTSSEWDNEWHMYTWVAENTTRFKLYFDGKLVGTQTSSEIITELTYLSMGNAYQPNALYKELSMYDKALSTEEILKLYQPSMHIKKNGVMKSAIQEGILPGDNDAYWLTLGDSTISEDRRLVPVRENDIAFEYNSMWAGNATANIYDLTKSSSNWPSGNSNMHTLTTITSPHSFKVKGISTVPGAYSYVYPNYVTTNTVHSFQAVIKNNNANPLRYIVQMRDGSNGTGLTSTSTDTLAPGDVVKVKLPGTAAVSSGRITACISIYSDSKDGTVDAEVFDIQLEEGSFCSPFTSTSRKQSRLTYPPVMSGSVFSVSMWVYQLANDNSYNMTFDAYPDHLYIAMRSNDRLHFSFRNNGVQASLYSTVGSTNLHKWHHIGAIKKADTIEMYLDGELVNTHKATGTGYSMTCSETDIGSYGTNYPFNGYIRDVIIDVGNKYLTGAKMKEIYQTEMRSFKNNKTAVTGQIIEGGL